MSADFDSDGFVDLAVAAPGVYVGGYGRDLDWAQGAVFILYGPWDLSLSPPYAGGSIAIVEDAANRRNDPAVHAVGDQFGFRIAVGDPNADSHPDLVIGSPFSVCSADAHNYCGQAYVYWGPSFTDWYELTLPGPPHGPPRNDRLWGLDVACGNVVDVETVGTDDVLIAAYNSEEGGTGNAGRFRLFRDFPNASPGPRGFDRYEDVLRPGGNVLGADFGEVLALGNYDGDHLLDVAVSAPRDFGVADGDNISGEVPVFPGASFPTGSIRLTISRPSAARKDMFGAAMAWLDHDADGIDELLVGAPWYNLGSSPPIGRHGEGRAVLVNFPRLHAWIDDPSPQELTSADGFGSAAAAGALDDNPRIDLAIGNPAASFTSGSTTFVLAGEVRVVID
ncbi:MAG: integrin alpha [Planctomycetota bacterium]